MEKYVATRESLCAGELLKAENIAIKANNGETEVTEEQRIIQSITGLYPYGGLVCRGMLFNVNEDGVAHDLRYTTEANYAIEGILPKVSTESDFLITRYVELDELLRYLKYGKDLTQEDINQIYCFLIANNWWIHHHLELFGWKKIYDRSTGASMWDETGGEEKISKSIYDNLSWISCARNGAPHPEEPGYSRIMKRK